MHTTIAYKSRQRSSKRCTVLYKIETPPELYKYSDEFRYFQHLLLRCRRVDDLIQLTPVHRGTLQAIIGWRATTAIVDWIKRNDSIRCDGHYIVGEKCQWYSFSPVADELPTRFATVESDSVNERLMAWRRKKRRSYLPQHRHYLSWVDRLELPSNAADAVDAHLVLSGESSKRDDYLRSVIKIVQGVTHDSVDDFGRRLHHTATNTPKVVRAMLEIGGEKLCTIDVANSQPMLMWVALGRERGKRGERKGEGGNPSHYDSPSSLKNDVSHCISEDNDFAKMPELPSDFLAYLGACERGELYAVLQRAAGLSLPKSKFKKVWFMWLFGPWRTPDDFRHMDFRPTRDDPQRGEWMREPSVRLAEAFLRLYPNVAEAVRVAKLPRKGLAKPYSGLVQDMQRLESKIMIEDVGGVLMREYPQIPAVPIHDAIMTTPEHVDTVHRLIKEAYQRHGVTPTLNIEYPQSESYAAAA